MSNPIQKVPKLNLYTIHSFLGETSPRSEEFREESISHSAMININKNTANIPNATMVFKETKNPLTSSKIEYSSIITTQNQEIQILKKINSQLSKKLEEFEKELSLISCVPSLMKEKDKNIKSLEISLELAQEELTMLQTSINAKQNSSKTTVFSYEFYGIKTPKRIWKSCKEVNQIDLMRKNVVGMIALNK